MISGSILYRDYPPADSRVIYLMDSIQKVMIPGGNRCGHRPWSPIFSYLPFNRYTEKKSKKHVWVIQKARDRIRSYYYYPENLLTRLRRYIKKDGTLKNRKSERREGHVRLLDLFITWMDLNTFMILGDYGITLTYGLIQKHTKLHFKRIERILDDLRRAGYLYKKVELKIVNAKDKLNGSTTYKKTMKLSLTPAFFHALGIKSSTLERTRHNKRHSNNEKRYTRLKDTYHINDKDPSSVLRGIKMICKEKEIEELKEKKKKHLKNVKQFLSKIPISLGIESQQKADPPDDDEYEALPLCVSIHDIPEHKEMLNLLNNKS